jgi:hypothetical protein
MSAPSSKTPAPEAVKPGNFIRSVIEEDLAKGTYAQRHWGGEPGDGQKAQIPLGILTDPARAGLAARGAGAFGRQGVGPG